MDLSWLRSLVWMDYRLAIVFAVIIPFILLIWAVFKQSDVITRLMIIYWRVASLLAITVYLLVGVLPIGFASAFAARILIPLSLWFWVDLNEEIDDIPAHRPLKLVLTAWRWAMTIYMGLGAIAQVFFLRCAFLDRTKLLADTRCNVWLDAPWQYKQIFHPNWTEGFVGFIGLTAFLIYVLYFSYFVLIRLGKQGRSALEQ